MIGKIFQSTKDKDFYIKIARGPYSHTKGPYYRVVTFRKRKKLSENEVIGERFLEKYYEEVPELKAKLIGIIE